jgi:predicted CXXCH cytochrome family protein
MTQLASDQSILAPFDGRVLESETSTCTVSREGEWYVVDMVDPDWEASEFREGIDHGPSADAPRVRLPVVMTTGSHHLQAYWVPSEHGNKVRIFPWVYHIDKQRWIPNGDSFILPPHSKRYPQVWNNSCILCHSVAGDVGYERGNWQSRVAELGISCEACHGPGAAHVKRQSNPLTRYTEHLLDRPDPTIVNPARLSHSKSSEVCGQCHTGFDEQASTPYNSYRAGGDFHSVFSLADPKNPDDLRFWPDGTMRVGGREYTGMIESACFQKGELSCLSCHSMHKSKPDKQMRPEMLGDQACVQCHASIAENLTGHTHHLVDSSGSRCYNCHMPHTSYALFSAIRSHRIDSPNLATDLTSGRPNACNQCHVDQTLAWTDKYLGEWYGSPHSELNAEQRIVPAAVLWLTQGDAIQRVLAAWSLGWQPAREAAGDNWQAPFLAELLDDPYSMVRYMAHDSLTKIGSADAGFDYLISPEERPSAAEKFHDTWRGTDHPKSEAVRAFFDDEHEFDRKSFQELLQRRDDRPITLYE